MKMEKIYKTYKIIKIVLYSILILCICFFAYYIIKRLVDKDKPSKIFGRYIVEVAPGSGSMYNKSEEFKDISLSPGDLLFVKPLKKEEYKVGMTVTFYDKQNVITTHQIIRIEGDTLITKGINKDNSEDEPITYEMLIGSVISVWRGFRKKVNFFTSPIGIVIVLTMIIGVNFGLNYLDKKLKENSLKTKKQETNLNN